MKNQNKENRKKILMGVATLVIGVTVAFGVKATSYAGIINGGVASYNGFNKGNVYKNSVGSTAAIDEKAAKTIALENAGLTESDVTVVKLNGYTKQGVPYYKIVFFSANTKYYYEINGDTGAIIRSHQNNIHNYNNNPSNTGKGTNVNVSVTAEEAINIAFIHAGVNSSTVRDLDCDYDKKGYYEIEFVSGNMEYEYEVDANSGDVLFWESDWD